MDQKDLKQISDLLDNKFAAYDKKMDIKIESKLDHRISQLEQKMFEWKSEIVNHIKKVIEDLARDRIERKIRCERIQGF